MADAASDVWVFGYGSLMWQPGFAFAEARHARLTGFHRAFCVYSIHYRGTTARPGLVLGLDQGGSCEGIAFRLTPDTAAATLAYLRRRELIYGVYRERLLPIALAAETASTATTSQNPTEGPLLATAFVAERAHPAYAGRLSLRRQVELIRGARGRGGTNLDYVLNTLAHLESLGIKERELSRIRALAGAFAATATCTNGARPRALAIARSWSARPLVIPRTVRDNRFCHRVKLATVRGPH